MLKLQIKHDLKKKICLFQITTPSKRYLEYGYLQRKPFYREPWFLVALAAASIVIIIMVVAVLCVKSKSYKYKGNNTLWCGCVLSHFLMKWYNLYSSV